ncbi:MAG: hypothetical protein RIC55_07945 [Pirellulaceae bacterium]
MSQATIRTESRELVVESVPVVGVYTDNSRFNGANELHYNYPHHFAPDAQGAEQFIEAERARWKRHGEMMKEFGGTPTEEKHVTLDGEAVFAGTYEVLLVDPRKAEGFEPANWWDIPRCAFNEESINEGGDSYATRLSALECVREWNLAFLAGEKRWWAVAVEFSRPVGNVTYWFSLMDGMGVCHASQSVAIRPLVLTDDEHEQFAVSSNGQRGGT